MSKKKTTKVKVKETPVKMGAVIYTDGSAQPNPGYGGYGLHGYTYDVNKPIQPPTSQVKNILTNVGYQPREMLGEEHPNGDLIKAFRKIDTITGYGTAPTANITNNTSMELHAIRKAIEASIQHQFEELSIITDSKTSIGAMTHWFDKWKSNGWRKADGNPIKHKDELIEIHDLKKKLEKGCRIQWYWVKGHSGEYGNEIVDKLAKKGASLHQANRIYDELTIGKPPEKQPAVYHDLFTKNRWYFMGGKTHLDNPLKIGNYYAYFTGALGQGKKDDSFGMHSADGCNSIILLKEPEPILSRIQSIYQQYCGHEYDFVVCGNLDTALSPANYHDIMSDQPSGTHQLIIQDESERVLSLPNGKVVCMEYNPAHLSYIQMTRYDRLVDMAKYHLSGDTNEKLVYTDITSDLMCVEDVGKKKPQMKYTLQPMISSRNYLRVPVQYKAEDGTIKAHDVKMTLKVDMPDKIHLGKLIKNHGANIKIRIASLAVSPNCFIYCTIVETDVGLGFWTNFDTAVVFH